MSNALELERPRREALRQKLVDALPRWYSPALHLAFPSIVGLALIATSIAFLREPTWLELAFVPFVLLVSNATEWRVHRDVLHKRVRFLEVIFDRHTPEHHAIYVDGDLSIRSRREFALVLIPAYGIVAIFFLTFPFTLTLELIGQRNLALLFVASTMFYVVSYEWAHLSYHMPEDSFVGRLGIVRMMKRHHSTHHRPELMQTWNFNVTLPLWDLVRGTIYREPKNVEKH